MTLSHWLVLFLSLGGNFTQKSNARALSGMGPHGTVVPSEGARGVGRARREGNPIAADGRLDAGVCRDLASAVCGGRGGAESRIERSRRAIVRGFLAVTRTSAESFSRAMGDVFGAGAPLVSKLSDFLQGRLGPAATQAGERARARLLQAVQDQAIPAEVKTAMIERVRNVRIRFFPDPSDPDSVRRFIANCGADQMAARAFAVPGENTVEICPGMVAGGADENGSVIPEAVAASLMHVLAHECGHCIGADAAEGFTSEFRPRFSGFRGCLQSRFRDSQSDGRLGEMVADFWGAQALAREVAGKRPMEALEYLRRAVGPLCATTADAEHPSGRFRINVLLAETPGIARSLGCRVEPEACAIDGTVGGER